MWSSIQTGVLALLAHPGTWVIALFVVTATYIQFRGRVRLKLRRQIFDHSTFTSPYNSLMYAFSSAPTTPYVDVAAFPQLKMLADNWTLLRDEGLKLFDEGHIKAAEKHNDAGFRTFFRTGWKRFYLKWYDDPVPSATALCPRASRPVRHVVALSPRARHGELTRLLHRRGRPALLLEGRRSRHVRRDVRA